MKRMLYLCASTLLVMLSCTKEKTNYPAETGTAAPKADYFAEAYKVQNGKYNVIIEALNGKFCQGYNEIRVRINHAQPELSKGIDEVTLLPIYTDAGGQNTSCPHGYRMHKSAQGDYYQSYVVFTEQSNPLSAWTLYINFAADGQQHEVQQVLTVSAQDNTNLGMVRFDGNDSQQYIIALIAPRTPKVGAQHLQAGIFRLETTAQPSYSPLQEQSRYVMVPGYNLLLDPRMPEPAMGNHSSPHNQDLVQREDGVYQGVVNYTMTGNWTLNFILLDALGYPIKGTAVPTDFTPGIPGAKSDLFIDIEF